MVTLQLHNITFSMVGLERILTWQNLQQTTKHSRGLTNLYYHYPYVFRNSDTEKERKRKRKIRDITTLGSSDDFCWWLGSFSGGCTSLLTIAWHLYTKVTKSST